MPDFSDFSDPVDCVDCPRLSENLAVLRQRDPLWHNRPVPSFGSLEAQLLIVGLAPGEKGANRTGRPFSGDVAGELLYPALYRFGLASCPKPLDADKNANPDMVLFNTRITNAVRCLPPANKPELQEIRQCNAFLKQEMAAMPCLKAVFALGAIAHQSVLRAFGLKPAHYVFGHDVCHRLPGHLPVLFDSYHCSGYNWRTGRLTKESFEQALEHARDFLYAQNA